MPTRPTHTISYRIPSILQPPIQTSATKNSTYSFYIHLLKNGIAKQNTYLHADKTSFPPSVPLLKIPKIPSKLSFMIFHATFSYNITSTDTYKEPPTRHKLPPYFFSHFSRPSQTPIFISPLLTTIYKHIFSFYNFQYYLPILHYFTLLYLSNFSTDEAKAKLYSGHSFEKLTKLKALSTTLKVSLQNF